MNIMWPISQSHFTNRILKREEPTRDHRQLPFSLPPAPPQLPCWTRLLTRRICSFTLSPEHPSPSHTICQPPLVTPLSTSPTRNREPPFHLPPANSARELPLSPILLPTPRHPTVAPHFHSSKIPRLARRFNSHPCQPSSSPPHLAELVPSRLITC